MKVWIVENLSQAADEEIRRSMQQLQRKLEPSSEKARKKRTRASSHSQDLVCLITNDNQVASELQQWKLPGTVKWLVSRTPLSLGGEFADFKTAWRDLLAFGTVAALEGAASAESQPFFSDDNPFIKEGPRLARPRDLCKPIEPAFEASRTWVAAILERVSASGKGAVAALYEVGWVPPRVAALTELEEWSPTEEDEDDAYDAVVSMWYHLEHSIKLYYTVSS